MRMSTSEAAVRYATEVKETESVQTVGETSKSIEIKIADMVMVPYALMVFGYQQDDENESEEGYEKSVLVNKKYKGTEEGKTGESKSCKLSFGVEQVHSHNGRIRFSRFEGLSLSFRLDGSHKTGETRITEERS